MLRFFYASAAGVHRYRCPLIRPLKHLGCVALSFATLYSLHIQTHTLQVFSGAKCPTKQPKDSCKTEIKDRNDYIIRHRRYVFRSGHESVRAKWCKIRMICLFNAPIILIKKYFRKHFSCLPIYGWHNTRYMAAHLPIYCHRYFCSNKHHVNDFISFWASCSANSRADSMASVLTSARRDKWETFSSLSFVVVCRSKSVE